MTVLSFERTAPSAPAAAELIRELDAELAQRYPLEAIHGLHADEVHAFPGVFLVGRCGGEPVACGAVRRLDSGVGELKRMYVRPAMRRRGLARQLLDELESVARELHLLVLKLETGVHQPEAVALYERAGYRSIPAYGEYVGNSYSLCYQKSLDASVP
jgi:putative acetyltransferase